MATAWIDKDSDGVENTVQAVINGSRIVVTVDPLPEKCASEEFAKTIYRIDKSIVYNGISMNNYLCADDNNVLALSEIIQATSRYFGNLNKT